MYVYVYVCMYVCMYVCIYIYVCIFIGSAEARMVANYTEEPGAHVG